MTTLKTWALTLIAVAAPRLPARLCAQAYVAPPVHPIGRVLATTTDTIGALEQLRALSDGRVVINDAYFRHIVIYDANLERRTVSMDSTRGGPGGYDSPGLVLIPFFGDSSLVVDTWTSPVRRSMRVIDPLGKVARTIAVPWADRDLAGISSARIYFDERGGLIYSVSVERSVARSRSQPQSLQMVDSSYIVRADVVTGRIDTLTTIKSSGTQVFDTAAAGHTDAHFEINPLPAVDAWMVEPGGALAAVRGVDFHLDWFGPDGKEASGPPIPYDWERLTDRAKVAVVDTAKLAAAMVAKGRPARPDRPYQVRTYVEPSALGSGRRAFRAVGLAPFADADGNVWIHVAKPAPAPGGPLYDVINRDGKLIERIQLLPGSKLVGLGSGVAYVTSRVDGRNVLSRVQIH